MDVLSLLERRDKCFLGGGKGALYAPPFPKHLLAPGFWDECFFADIKIPRLFTVLVLDAQGRPFRFQSTLESWRPDRLLIRHVSEGLEIIERRSVVESQAWVSHFEILRSPGELDFFLWSLPDQREIGYGAPWQSCGDCSVKGKSIGFPWLTAWPAELEPDRSATEDERVEGLGRMLPALPVYLELGCSLPRKSFSVNLAQQHDFGPLWELSMVPELYTGKLPNEVKQHVGVDAGGLLHIVQHYRWRSGPVRFAAGAGLTETAARDSLHQALRAPVDQSTTEWTDHFRRVPQFACSDPFFTNAYWYRWYGLRLNTVDVPGLSISGTDASFGPFVTEGVGFFRNFVTYSAQAHLREVAWMESSALASGILDNLVRVQRLDGSYPGHNYSCRPARDFYHADFATGLHLVRARFPEVDATEWLRSLSAYRSYFQRDRTG
ncbi:MAG TPA: hypothetical protein VEX38_09860, partial [Fimbriimonadaceae bacterium]|nr:hypothetical protein [Fimbriimonadaceae bacterium]